ncbi:MAG: N-acetyltransferase [Gammaproteobacteria bacterium]
MTTSNYISASNNLTVVPVSSRRDLKTFIQVPWHIYSDDPQWVPPLRLERRLHFSSLNPYFKHAKWQAWVAFRGEQPVGRISAQIDQVHRNLHGKHSGQFGLIESVNDPKVFAALFKSCEAWLKEQNSINISGPFNFSINQECGVLVSGFKTPPVILMPHSREWYGPMIEDNGYLPAMDLLAYWINLDFKASPVMSTIVKRYKKRIHLRSLRRNKFKEELEILRDIFNDAWSTNWGYIPFSKEEFAELGNSLRFFIPDEFIQIAELNGKPAAFIVVLPNINEVLRSLDGKLFPLGWLKLLKAVKKNDIRTGRVPLMGVRKEFQNSPVGMALSFMVCSAGRDHALKNGIEGVEMSWILENNKGMRNVLDNVGSPEYKRYRIYEKTI